MPRYVTTSLNDDLRITFAGTTSVQSLVGKRWSLSRRDNIPSPVSPIDGWRNPAPYWSTVTREAGPYGTWQSGSGYYGVTREGNLNQACDDGYTRQAPDFTVGLRSKAEVQALLQLKDQQVNLSQAFAERAQTSRLIGDNLLKIAKAAVFAKKGLIRGAAEILTGPGKRKARKFPRQTNWRDPVRNMGSFWLELQYGWRPLLSDIHGAALQLDKYYPPESYRVRVKGKAKELNEYKFLQNYPGFAPCNYHCQDHVECRVRLFYTPKLSGLQAAFGSAGLSNPLYIAWELVPFSFIADWAIPIGDWLNSLDASNGFTFRGGDRTEYRSRVSHLSGHLNSPSNYSAMKGFREYTRSDRHIYSDPPFAQFPSFKNPWGIEHGANSAALLSQVLKGTGGGGARMR